MVLVGTPGRGKSALAESIQGSEWKIEDDSLSSIDPEHAVGDLMDYRLELWVASDRAIKMRAQAGAKVIHTNSLLDSLAHATVRLSNASSGPAKYAERWMYMVALISEMVKDSFEVKTVIFLPGNDGSQFSKDLEDAYQEIFKWFNIQHETVEGDKLQMSQKSAKLLEAWNEQK